ncbi:hypothetical protein [Endozoicomonas sp. 8E]|uniref:hypothetical protein n=1 Tax=Endozoicomonas sp. 8E TaxID=3035692 RepID=UPI002939147F|nr:hypothetical protein [Endozoicomonas sp. 8E]WOG27696.1 hypothetical protein P6910_24635 [Endozoicomonas sp. 8E]
MTRVNSFARWREFYDTLFSGGMQTTNTGVADLHDTSHYLKIVNITFTKKNVSIVLPDRKFSRNFACGADPEFGLGLKTG